MSGSRLGLYLSFQTFSWRSISWFHPAQLTVPVGLEDTSQLQARKTSGKKRKVCHGMAFLEWTLIRVKSNSREVFRSVVRFYLSVFFFRVVCSACVGKGRKSLSWIIHTSSALRSVSSVSRVDVLPARLQSSSGSFLRS